jgi:glycosyltransferase involved in cell wall biosynthesis
MKVSALIPTYNRRKYIFRAIDSILSQTPPVTELIVVDDGSTDGSADAIEERYGSKVRLIRQENMGVSGARLRAIHEARGEWIAFLDSDDEWLPGRQEAFLAAVEKLPPNVAWLFGDMRSIDDDGDGKSLFEKGGATVSSYPQVFENSLSVLYPLQFAWLQSSLIRKDVLLEVGCFTADLRTHEDRLAAFQVACSYKFAAIPSIVTKLYRTSDLLTSSLTHNGVNTPDHYRALMLTFPLLMKKTGKRDPWAEYHAGAVRGLCKLRAAQKEDIRQLAMEQFRYGTSFKSLAFFCFAAFGTLGLHVWEQSAALGRAIRRTSSVEL